MKTSPHKLTERDLVFAAINGAIFGLGFTLVSNSSIPFFPELPFLITTLAFSIAAAIGVAVGAALAQWRGFFFQLAKFGVVGAANTAVDLGTYNLIILAVGGSTTVIGAMLFKGLSFTVAVINSYIWNRYWSFGKKDEATAGEFTKFVSVSVIGLVLNATITGAISYFAAANGIVSSTLATLAAAIASVLVLAWNFLGYKLFVFKK